MKVVIASDHAGYELKEILKGILLQLQIPFEDFGTDSHDSVDYPDYGARAAEAVSEGRFDQGILVCGSGIGMTIVADKTKNIRAALCFTPEMASMAKTHNNANILTLGSCIIKHETAIEILKTFLNTIFTDKGRHQRRINKIHQITGV